MNDERARRVGLNESIFRQVNEQIESLNKDFGSELRSMTAICECADGDCTERFEIRISDYEQVRSDPRHFLIVPGHAQLEYEAVIEQGDGYEVVEKREGDPADLARETDPRS